MLAVTGQVRGSITFELLYPHGRPGGWAYLVPVLEGLRRQYPQLVLLDAGDAVIGAPEDALALARRQVPLWPPAALQVLNRLHVDGIALGKGDLQVGRAGVEGLRNASAFPWLAANVLQAPGQPWLAPYQIVQRAGLRVAVLGLASPGVPAWVSGDRIAGLAFTDTVEAARAWVPRLRAQEHADVVIALVQAGPNTQVERDTALLKGLPLPNAAGLIADSVPGLDLVISAWAPFRPHSARSGAQRGRPHPANTGTGASAAQWMDLRSSYRTPLVSAGLGGRALTLIRLELERGGARWHARAAFAKVVPAARQPDAATLLLARPALAAAQAWLAQPTRAVVAAPASKKALHACTGALAHQATEFAGRALGLRQRAPDAISLLPMLWRVQPLRRRDVGTVITQAHLRRWLPEEDTLLLARLTGRQVELLLGPYVRHLRGWRVPPSQVFHPGGLELSIAPRGSRVLELARSGTRSPLRAGAEYPVWLTSYAWSGGGGLLPKALVQPTQLLLATEVSLRDAVMAWMSADEFAPPPACQPFLAPRAGGTTAAAAELRPP